ncbi:MAG: YjaG family protein [Candidatus Sumerlaeaceae bacterium]|nr:YjaG family protein [Candidatus Sumerlaeaceae bacterium]
MLEALTRMQPHQQLAFGAACCERMLPNYKTFMNEVGWGNVEPLRQAVDVAWEACEDERPSEAELRNLLSQCEQCTPDSEDYSSLYTASAQDAVFSVCALLDFLLDGDVDHIVTVARYSTDTVDLVVQEREGMDPQDARLEQRILQHAFMQQELARQKRDLREAIGIGSGDKNALLAFRTRAQQEPNLEAISE